MAEKDILAIFVKVKGFVWQNGKKMCNVHSYIQIEKMCI